MFLSIMMKSIVTAVASSKKHTKFKTRVQKPYPKAFTCMTKTAEKPYPLGLHIRLYIAHRVLHPPSWSWNQNIIALMT